VQELTYIADDTGEHGVNSAHERCERWTHIGVMMPAVQHHLVAINQQQSNRLSAIYHCLKHAMVIGPTHVT